MPHMDQRRVGKWAGGYIRREEDGSLTYWIRKSVRNDRFEVSTRCSSEEAAMDHYKSFQRDPHAYRASGVATEEPLYLDTVLAKDFLAWSLGRKQNSRGWVNDQARTLEWWGTQLRGVDLRRVTRQQVAAKLDGVSAERLKVKVVKHLFTWLVRHRRPPLLDQHPLRDLVVPPSRPSSTIKAFSKKTYDQARRQLPSRWRDLCDVLAGTAWHVSELNRFAHGGEVERLPRHGWVLTCPHHKKGRDPFKTPVSASVAAAAKRVRAAGPFNRQWLLKQLKRLSDIKPGAFRHSVATHAVNEGADLAAVATLTRHDRNIATLAGFYARNAIPARVPTLR